MAAPTDKRPLGPPPQVEDPGALAGLVPAEETLLVLQLSPERFAIPTRTVVEIIRAVAITALPGAPPVVEGVINYRGRIVPVVDPRRRFGLPAIPLNPDQHFVVVTAGPRSIALRVDRATELVTVAADAIARAAEVAPAAPYVSGVVRLDDGLLVVHDLERFLSLEEETDLDRALERMADATAHAREISE